MSTERETGSRLRAKLEPTGDVTVFRGADPLAYCWNDQIKFAVNVALATGRALLLQGEPGVGKSVVAEAVAEVLNWRFYSHTVSSRTEAQDLTWKFDYVRRLGDAHAQIKRDECAYLVPGPFWWAFDIDSAERQGGPKDCVPCLKDPRKENASRRRDGAVVLIDEIDKADPAVANDLLETVGSGRFEVTGVADHFPVEWRRDPIEADNGSEGAPKGGLLMVFTSNNERDLPDAFLRRCIVETMAWPKADNDKAKVEFDQFLRRIAQRNWSRLSTADPADPESSKADELIRGLAEAIWKQRKEHEREDRRPPGLAEFLDAIAACRELGVVPGKDRWETLSRLVWRKA